MSHRSWSQAPQGVYHYTSLVDERHCVLSHPEFVRTTEAAQAPYQWANHSVRFPRSPLASPPRVRPIAFPSPHLRLFARSSPSSQSLQAITPSSRPKLVQNVVAPTRGGNTWHRYRRRRHTPRPWSCVPLCQRCAPLEVLLRSISTLHLELTIWPYGLMDKALVFWVRVLVGSFLELATDLLALAKLNNEARPTCHDDLITCSAA